MANLFKKLAGFLIYKEPKNEEHGFELLEGENEGNESNPAQEKESGRKGRQTDGNRNNKPGESQNIESGGKLNKEPGGSRNNVRGEALKKAKTPISVDDWIGKRKNEKTEEKTQSSIGTEKVSGKLDENLSAIKKRFDMPTNQDIIIREFKIGRKIKAFMVYIDGMIDENVLQLSVYPRLMAREIADEIGVSCPVDFLIESVLAVYQLEKYRKFEDIVLQVLRGSSALFVDTCNECIVMDTKGYKTRQIESPVIESVVQGSQEGFTENLRTNLTMVRRIIKNEKLVVEYLSVGEVGNSTCAVLYLSGIANPEVVVEVKKRIKKISTDFVMGDGMIEQFIEDNPFKLFPQVLSTERPDRAASFITEGQVVIIGEGTPFALTVPVTFFRLFHTSEDSFARWPFGTFLRLIRTFGLFCATLLPGLYTALALYHPEAIPTELLFSLSSAKETVPFPTIIEVLIMEISFELIREGGVRVPSVIGQTLGIVGALILGQAAVSAGLVSPAVVIVVSITALGNFAIPNYSLALAIRIERFFFIFLGAMLGMYGVSLVIFFLAVMACGMKSFGVPFFSPVAPRTKINPDVIFRYPIWMQSNRPDEFNTLKRKRQGENIKNWSKE